MKPPFRLRSVGRSRMASGRGGGTGGGRRCIYCISTGGLVASKQQPGAFPARNDLSIQHRFDIVLVDILSMSITTRFLCQIDNENYRFDIESTLICRFGGHIAVDSTSCIDEFVDIESTSHRRIIFGWVHSKCFTVLHRLLTAQRIRISAGSGHRSFIGQ